jgi:MFS superfamily sulfate permease-like transporter
MCPPAAFRYTPLFVLASIVVSAAVLLIDYEEVIFLFKIGDRGDLAQMLIVFLGTLLLGPGSTQHNTTHTRHTRTHTTHT